METNSVDHIYKLLNVVRREIERSAVTFIFKPDRFMVKSSLHPIAHFDHSLKEKGICNNTLVLLLFLPSF